MPWESKLGDVDKMMNRENTARREEARSGRGESQLVREIYRLAFCGEQAQSIKVEQLILEMY